LLKPVLAYGYPMVFSALSLFLFQFGDRFILRIFSPLGEVGLLTFAATFQVVFLTLVHEPGKKAINPVIFGCENDPVRVRMIVRRSANYLSVFSLGIWICVAIFSREIARVLGRSPEYWDAWKLIPVVSFSGVLFGMNDLAGKGIAMKRKSSLIMKISLICVGINVVLNLLAIPAFGAMGAALATCASFMIMLVLKASFSFRIYGLQFDVKTAGKATVLAMVLFTCGLLCNRLPFHPSIAAKSVLVLSFPLTLFALGVLGPEDIRRARSLFSRGANPAEA
jgi:O-antigen/teichoic acid export membrane protein